MDYDSVVVGSSPPLVALALRLAKQGQKVLVVEKSDLFGGAWHTASFSVFEDIDAYCHVFVQDFGAFRVMRNELNWKIEKVKPQPQFVYKGLRTHYNNPLRYLVAVIEPLFMQKKHKSNPSVWDVKNAKLSEVFEFCRILFQTALTTVIRRISYPAGGTKEIIDRLRLEMKNYGVDYQSNCRAVKYEIKNGENELTLSTGKVRTSRLFISTGSEIQKVVEGDREFKPQFENSFSHHIYLHLKSSGLAPISYLYFGGNPVFGRVYEPPTSKASVTDPEERLYIVQLRNSFHEEHANNPQIADLVLKEMIEQKIVSERSEIVEACSAAYASTRMRVSDLETLKRSFSSGINYMHVTNIARGIHESYRLELPKATSLNERTLGRSHFRGEKVRVLGVEKLVGWLRSRDLLTPDKKVLDYGCGEFDLGSSIVDKVGVVDGFDIRKQAVDRCREKFSLAKSSFFEDTKQIPSGKYDLILMNGVVQYMSGEEELYQFLKNTRSWISESDQACLIMTCVIEKNYSPVRDAISWLKAAAKRGAFIEMFFHVLWGGWNTVIAKNNPTLVLSPEVVDRLAKTANWSCQRQDEDLTYSNTERSTYIFRPEL